MIDHLADGRPHGDLVDAGARDVAADPDELDAGGAVCPLRLEPLHALDEDQWHGRERLDVVDDRRLLPQPVRPGKRRLVPRLRALVLDGLEQRRLLAADVPARADEHAHVEGQVRAEDAPTEQAVATAGGQLALEMFGLRLVLVAYIDDALVGADDEAGQNHALDHQMRHVIEDEAVLDGPRLALVGIAHDVLRRPGRPPHDLPLHPRREAGAAEAPEVAGLERAQQLAHVPARDERAHGFVPAPARVRVEAQRHRRRRRFVVRHGSAAGDRRDEIVQLLGGHAGQDHDIDDGGGSPVAAHERTGSAQMARHVAADLHLDHGRWRETEVRIEARHALDLVERHAETLRQGREFLGRQVAVLTLDRPETFDDHACGYQWARYLGRRPSVNETRTERLLDEPYEAAFQLTRAVKTGVRMAETQARRLVVLLKSASVGLALLAAHCGVASADALQAP